MSRHLLVFMHLPEGGNLTDKELVDSAYEALNVYSLSVNGLTARKTANITINDIEKVEE